MLHLGEAQGRDEDRLACCAPKVDHGMVQLRAGGTCQSEFTSWSGLAIRTSLAKLPCATAPCGSVNALVRPLWYQRLLSNLTNVPRVDTHDAGAVYAVCHHSHPSVPLPTMVLPSTVQYSDLVVVVTPVCQSYAVCPA